ncbi:7-cyano-7-deazaguanine reductase [Chitinivorax tropicus]|uniref:NADPH-dependent 7-cyano-7-deazaguanine reductase n=1 Tax=Chitinivorax tropicus TaxID=714531 RepID=A0A840MKD1_9PROT|nr:NADPH-dependent 7-cyano-7-deazaguanine reductase QueF [Chitinivorax tropicus]MBB5019644.1 7-cyano-7-deazaguanine reductase [Chitinivorax tropicus]
MHNTPEASPLGKAVSYLSQYTPSLLHPILRVGKRAEIGIAEAALPFWGEDLWNAYELSWLNARGKPVVAIGTFRVPACSPCLIESKSLKLYLNSFNQTRFSSLDEVSNTITTDLSQAAGSPVKVQISPVNVLSHRHFAVPNGVLLDELDVEIDTYQPAPALLTTDSAQPPVSEWLYSHLLKSNCLVTGQPDWGMVSIRYTGQPIDRAGLLKYIISFRDHNEFHEQCVERIYMDIQQRCKPTKLEVWARYTRRGGLDINPYRSSEQTWVFDNHHEIRQ